MKCFIRYVQVLTVGLWILLVGSAWADNVETALMPGQVIEAHAKWEDTCTKCHKRFDKAAQATLCLDCHKDVRQDIDLKHGAHGRFKEQRDCKECHTDHKGRAEQIAPITKETFDHERTDFPLNGAHADDKKVECVACHKPKVKFRDAPSDCYSCHKKDDKHKGKVGTVCATCHTDRNWKVARFDHDPTRFKLRNKHVAVPCKDCHANERYKDTPLDCYSCHKKDDKHKGQEGQKCEECHNDRSWKGAPFDHNKARFPLMGKHAKLECKQCHLTPAFKDASMECYSCHKKDDKHKGKVGTVCTTCHTDRNWKVARFDHDPTRFKLRNKHVAVPCKDCHANERYKDTPLDCYSCHKKDDKHKGQEGQKCEECHNDRSWKEAPFDHNKARFLLIGKHAELECKQCHLTPVFQDAPTDCYGCHKKDDKHKGTYGEKCGTCHGDRDWKTIMFDHDLDTQYPLRGRHVSANCESCHTGQLYKEKTPVDCSACHKKDDKHKSRFGEKCERCHTERDWKVLLFNHNRDTAYRLKGYHQKTKCESCHAGTLYKDKTPDDCYACHKKDDIHQLNFSEKCENCHGEHNWKIVAFDHDRDTKYVLIGKHRSVTCVSCHRGQLYKDKTPTACFVCHKNDDVHRRRLGTECQDCHGLRNWKLWDFDHDTRTRFKLDGGHREVDCHACHTTRMDKKVTTSSSCASCHKKDDKHEGSFGPQCDRCHDTTIWKTIKPGSRIFRAQ